MKEEEAKGRETEVREFRKKKERGRYRRGGGEGEKREGWEERKKACGPHLPIAPGPVMNSSNGS